MAILLCATGLLPGAGSTFAKKKAEKPVQERFEATIAPPISDDNSLQVAIEEFSTDEEVQNLAQAFARGGEDALWKVLHGTKKGYFTMGSGQTMPISTIESISAGGTRKLNIIGEAPSIFRGVNGSVSIGHNGYPYTWIGFVVDEQGNSKGSLIPYANIRFNKEGRMEIISMKSANIQLVNVHLQK